MYKPNKLLKVMSVILIVFGALGLIGTLISIVGSNAMMNMEGITDEMRALFETAVSPVSIALAVIDSLLYIIAGILSLKGKAFAICMGMIVLDIVLSIVPSLLTGAAMTPTFIFSLALGLIVPLLYIWGLYQSK